MERIYFDHNATTAPDIKVREAVALALEQGFGNPSSLHWFGQQARKLVEDARESVAAFLGAKNPLEIVFTSGGTEANYLAVQGAAQALAKKGKRIVTSVIEHPSVEEACRDLAAQGFEVITVPVERSGRVSVEAVREALTPETILVTVMAANNETGVVQPIAEIGALCRERKILFHTDAVQYAGKLKIDVAEWPVDLLSISGHKFYGPKGVGALWVKKGVSLRPRQKGGGQENGLRGGTENVPGISGLGAAAALAKTELRDWTKHLTKLRDLLENTVLENIPDAIVNGDRGHRVPNTTNISFLGAEGEAILLSLDLLGLGVSTGSACSSGASDPSHVLVAMGLAPEHVRCSIRFSLGKDNTAAEVQIAIRELTAAVARIRNIAGDTGRPDKSCR